MNNLRNITNNISGLQLLDEKELDITWDYFNLLTSSNEMLLFTLTKLCMIPMTDYMAPVSESDPRKVFELFDLTEEQALRVQSVNVELLNIQKALQIYCSQSFALSMLSSKFLSDLIDNIPEETNVQDIDSLMRTVQAFIDLKEQKGGAIDDTFKKGFFINLFKTLILFLLAAPAVQSSSQLTTGLELVTDVGNAYNPYNTLVISASAEQILEQLEGREFKKKEIDVSRSIAAYDRTFKNKYDGAIGTLISYFNQIDTSGKQQLLDIVDNVNNDLRNISVGTEKVCLELMKISYDKGIFRTWNTLDTIDQTNQKIKEAKRLAEEERSQSISNVGTSALSAAKSIAKGDVMSTVDYISSMGTSIWGLLSSTEKTQEKIESMAKELQPTSMLTLQQKKEYENKSYIASKLYCTFGYNLQLSFDEITNVLDVVGDKAEHSWIINLINVLEENLKVQITALTVDAQTDESKKTELNILVSTLQRLDILKAITNQLSDIINFSFKTHILKVQIQPSKNSINDIKTYFDNQLIELNSLLVKLNELFPKQIQQLEEEKEIVEANIELETLKQNVLDIKSNADAIVKQRAAERYAVEAASGWNATQTIVSSWFKIGESAIELAGTEAGNILGGVTKGIVGAVGQIPREFIRSNLDLVNGILWDLISRPGAGWIAISFPLFALLIYFGQILNFVRVFYYGGERCIYIISGTFVFIYRIVATPVGFLLRPIGRYLFGIGVQNQGAQVNLIEQPKELSSEEIAALGLLNLGKSVSPTEQMVNYNQYNDEDESEYSLFKKSGGKHLRKKSRKRKMTKRHINKLKKRTKKYNKKSKKHGKSKHRVKKHKKTKRKI